MTYSHFFRQLTYDIFCASLSVYALSLVVDAVKKGSILTIVDLNMLLVVVIASGIVSMLFPIQRSSAPYGVFEYILCLVVAVALALTVFRATESMGMWWALLLALGVGSTAIAIPLHASVEKQIPNSKS